MLEEVEAVRFDRMMSVGRTRPMLLTCERSDGQQVEVIAKFQRGCSTAGLVREAIGAMFAHDLALPVPEPFLVIVSASFSAAIRDPAALHALETHGGMGFGSKRLPSGFATWIEPAGHASSELDAEAQAIMAFDCWVTNGDRRAKNPNVLSNGKQFAVFDHEFTLMTTLNLFWKEPWLPKALDGSSPPKDHVFERLLSARADIKLTDIMNRLVGLSDARIDAYFAALPPSWAIADDAATRAISLIKTLRDNALPAVEETIRVLS